MKIFKRIHVISFFIALGFIFQNCGGSGKAPLAVPSSASAAGGSAAVTGTSQMTLAWDTPTPAVTSFSIQQSNDGVSYSTIALNLSGNSTSFVVGSLARNHTYYFKITATNSAGTSGASQAISAIIP